MDSNPPVTTPTTAPSQTTEDKTVAIVGYITLIGFIAAVIIHSNKKTKLGAFHLRQMLGLILTNICAAIVLIIPILGWIAFPIILLGLFVCWIMGLIAAINGQIKPAPIVGPMYQKWFGTTFD